MIFQRPDLLALAPAALLLLSVALLSQWRRGVRLVDAYGGPVSATRLIGRRIDRVPVARWMALSAACLALVVAAAGPDREPPEVVEVTPVDLLVAIDVSQSMSGGDVELTRIGRARMLVEQILEARVADRVALLLFADWTYDLVPLTNDPAVVSFFMPFVSPDLMSGRDQGTSLGPMFAEAVTTWQARARTDATAALLIVSDGEVHGGSADVLAAIDSVSSAGIQVWTAGAGSAEGAPLHLPGSVAPFLDGAGRPVVAGFDPALLAEMATRGGGRFTDISDDAGIRRLVGELDDIGGRAEVASTASAPSSAWLLLLAMVFLVFDAVLDVGAIGPRKRGTARPAAKVTR